MFIIEFKASKSEYDTYHKVISKWEGGATGKETNLEVMVISRLLQVFYI